MDSRWIAPIGLLTLAIGYAVATQLKHSNTFEDAKLLQRGMDKPVIWVYYDDTHVNSRWWADFGARSSRVLNLPFLNMCYQTIVKAAGDKYRVEAISGLADAAQRLGGWEALPPLMRNKKLPLEVEEYQYLKVAMLAKYGGLWISPAVVCLQAFPELPNDKVVFFGYDAQETYSGSPLPNQVAMWSPAPEHPFFAKYSQALYERIERAAGGREIRNDKNWDLTFFASGRPDVMRVADMELTRKANGRKIELEDLLATGTGGVLPFDIPRTTIYVPIPWPELLQRRIFGWFLRMSEDQIMESDIAIRWLFERAGL